MLRNGEIIDTYPWPYNDLLFANWPESNSKNDYASVFDPSGCIVKDQTSYCAYKIYETTGSWPKPAPKHRRFNAEDWRRFLRESDYYETDLIPSANFYYVGISRNSLRLAGEVVWFERYERPPEGVLVTTYDYKTFVPKVVRAPDYIWVKIARRDQTVSNRVTSFRPAFLG